MTIYIDIVLLENIIMNYIIIYATDIILKKNKRHIRFFIASFIGAIYSILAYISILKIYSNIFLKIILSIIIVYIALNPQNIKKMWKALAIFYLVSFVFGGVAFAMIYMVKPQNVLMRNGLFLGTYPLKTIILGAIISFVLIVVVFKIIKTQISKKSMYCDIEIKLNEKIINTKAMIDTGNLLKDPITNTPVIVVERSLLYECLPKEILNNIEKILGGDLDSVPENIKNKYISKLKIIPFSSLGKENGMLIGIKSEYIILKNSELQEDKKIKNIIVAIYEKSLTKKGEYRALVGLELV